MRPPTFIASAALAAALLAAACSSDDTGARDAAPDATTADTSPDTGGVETRDDTTVDTAVDTAETSPELPPCEGCAPVAGDDPDVGAVDEDEALVIPVATLLANDVAHGASALVVSAVGAAEHGSVALDGAAVTFTPAAHYSGPASFVYTVSAAGEGEDTATVTLTVAPVPDAPALPGGRGAEDEAIPVVVAALVDDDGSEALSDIVIEGVPPDVAISAGVATPHAGGPFAAPTFLRALDGTQRVIVAQLDGDRHDDLVATNILSNAVSVWLGRGDGTFAARRDYGSGAQQPGPLVVVDLDADGDQDIAVANFQGDSVSALLGRGDGTFAPARVHPVGRLPRGIAAGHFDADAHVDLVFVRFDSSNQLQVLRGAGDGTFSDGWSASLTTPGNLVVVGRLDEDAFDDLVVTQGNCSGTCVAVYLGNGDGTFGTPLPLVGGDYPDRAVIHDLDGDGAADLIVPATNSATVSVFMGFGDGTFAAPNTFDVETPTECVLGHFDDDGVLDLAVTRVNRGELAILRGHADGTFDGERVLDVGADPFSIAVGHFDGDRFDDLVVTQLDNATNLDGVNVLLQRPPLRDVALTPAEAASVTLTPPPDFSGTLALTTRATSSELATGESATTTGTLAVVVDPVADAPVVPGATLHGYEDEPLHLERLVAPRDRDGSETLSITLDGAPAGLTTDGAWLVPPPDFSGELALPATVTTTEPNGDTASATGLLTVAFEAVADAPSLSASDVAGAPGAATALAVSAALADDDGSEALGDVVIAGVPAGFTASAGVLAASPFEPFLPAATHATDGLEPRAVILALVDADPIPDVVTADFLTGHVSVRLGLGAGELVAAAPIELELGARDVAAGDFDGDGATDLVVVNELAQRVDVLLGRGDGTLEPGVVMETSDAAMAVAVGRLDGDAYDDLAVTVNASQGVVAVYLGLGDGTFAAPSLLACGSTPRDILIASIDGDAHADIVLTNQNMAAVSVLRGNGDGTFAARVSAATVFSPVALAAGDLNADQHVDLVVARRDYDAAAVLLNQGNGTFAAPLDVPVGDQPSEVGLADVDGDGHLDLAIPNAGTGTVSLRLGKGDGTFDVGPELAAGAGARAAATGDLDGDGAIDLVVANGVGHSVSVFLGAPGALALTVAAGQLAGLTLTAPAGFSGDVALRAIVHAVEAANASAARRTAPFVLQVQP